ncbi:hypothetical protein [Spirochaeta isovalerica]|uniref:Outer membrane protein beta-barrel domain-containing protein n=1 Tax=Spirochaeta isovalerica TaxID=150 RepID=A0A841R2N0_9SPIO|nr:hypothetical protein [Spirochaeta isovalerica]MBB6479284.1 hypothetical protein [Spirochaeta isovalerica]
MGKKSLAVLLLLITSVSLYAEGKDILTLSLSGGMTLDIAEFGLEKKFLSAGIAFQFPRTVSPGFKPQFSFNNDTWSLYLPAVLSLPIQSRSNRKITLEPYMGGGAVYFSDDKAFYPLVTGGLIFHIGSFFTDVPLYWYFHDRDSDFLIGLNLGWSFAFPR